MAGALEGRARHLTGLPVAHDLEQIAVGVKEVEAVVIAPIDRMSGLHASLGQALPGCGEIRTAHAKRVMTPAQRM